MLRVSHSQLSTYQTCHRSYYYKYTLKRVSSRPSEALSFGSAWAKLLEYCRSGEDPAVIETLEGTIGDTLYAKLCALYTHYEPNDALDMVAVEQKLELSICDGVEFVGYADSICQINGELYILEDKTTSRDIEGYGDYWKMLPLSRQINMYAYIIGTKNVIYNVVRKPQLRLRKNDTIDDYRNRMIDEIGKNKSKYYQCREIVLNEDVMEETFDDVKKTALELKNAIDNKWFQKSLGMCMMPYKCDYMHVCNGTSDIRCDDFCDKEFNR